MSWWTRQLARASNPARDAGWTENQPRKGFFTDTSICIGCKACEVACKEWNRVPTRPGTEDSAVNAMSAHSYDNSGHLGANTWRHVAFIEQGPDQLARARRSGAVNLGMPAVRPSAPEPASAASTTTATGTATATATPTLEDTYSWNPFEADYAADMGQTSAEGPLGDQLPPVRWLMSSDVCKHCTHAGCLDVCPTGALFRTEFGTVVVQPDVCNGCGYCVAACPFGVIGRRSNGVVELADGSKAKPVNAGVAQKCTLCYDRLKADQTPACAKTCPTTSIQFGDHDEMVDRARTRLTELHRAGRFEARLYGANPDDGVGGTGSVFLLLDEPEAYGLPPDPVVPTAIVHKMFQMAGLAGTFMIVVSLSVFAANRSRG